MHNSANIYRYLVHILSVSIKYFKHISDTGDRKVITLNRTIKYFEEIARYIRLFASACCPKTVQSQQCEDCERDSNEKTENSLLTTTIDVSRQEK